MTRLNASTSPRHALRCRSEVSVAECESQRENEARGAKGNVAASSCCANDIMDGQDPSDEEREPNLEQDLQQLEEDIVRARFA